MGVLHRGTVLLACTLVAVKAYYLGPPAAWDSAARYTRALTATSALDVVFALVLWAAGVAALASVSRRPKLARVIVAGFLATGALAALYAVASVVMFGIFGGFVTFPLLTLVGDVRMLRSSVALHLTPGLATLLVLLPAAYVAEVSKHTTENDIAAFLSATETRVLTDIEHLQKRRAVESDPLGECCDRPAIRIRGSFAKRQKRMPKQGRERGYRAKQ